MPVLDEITGLQFMQAYANGPHTARSLPSLLTSKRICSSELTDGPTIATVLRDSGITTGALHSNTAISTRYEQIDGFDTYNDYSTELSESTTNTVQKTVSQRLYNRLVSVVAPRLPTTSVVHSIADFFHEAISTSEAMHDFSAYLSAQELTTDAINWVRQKAGEEFFLWLHYMDPHRPYGLHTSNPKYADRQPTKKRLRELMATIGEHPETVTNDKWEYVVDLYDSEIRYTSAQINRFFQCLQEEGLWAETNVIITADHGEEFYDHGQVFHRNLPYEELIHVPLFVRTPDNKSGKREGIRELIDVGPTVLEWFNEQEPSFEGQSLFEGPDREMVSIGSIRHDDKAAAIRRGNYKLIQCWSTETEEETAYYDLIKDPDEQSPLEDLSSLDVDGFTTRLNDVVQDADLNYTVPVNSEATRNRLRHLGYLE